MSNFQFLENEFPEIYREAAEAEKHAHTAPRYCALLCRSAMEKTIHWLYAHDSDLHEPYDTRLSSLMHEQCFREILKPGMFREINSIRKIGNNAAHGTRVSAYEALVSIKGLFRFLSFLSTYYSESNPVIPAFDEGEMPDGALHDKTRKELTKVADQLSRQTEQLREERRLKEEQSREIELLRNQLKSEKQKVNERKQQRTKAFDQNKAIPQLIPESVTRKIYIDQSLKEAGWDHLKKERELEFEVTGMPRSTNPSGVGYADYVLWGDNGLPIAVIEAKRAMVEASAGKHQAMLYADCLEQMYGQRPVIFFSNGFETFIWDDSFYIERQVQGFYTKNELQLLIDRRKSRKDIRNFKVNTDIAGRPYQIESIQRIAESFVTHRDNRLKGKSRKALLVMATGSGKTRTSAAIVDMLTKCNWAKRVLFLADRNALVTQAKKAFKEHLPHLSAIDLTKEKEDSGTRLVFSTYPTIMNKIDSIRTDDNRFYGVGHFDLIIVDEAHRSVYKKYGAIFEYFDSMVVGLTATPKKDVDKNTYSLFDIEDDVPTFAYELNQAVNDQYLRPPKSMKVPIKFPREGIKYKELSAAEQEEYEEKFGDPTNGEINEEISNSAINTWLFNTDTVDKVLDYLMTNGIKVEGGDKLGKSIIFAKNHQHAQFVEERFNKNYPEYSGHFLRVIDNYESKAQDLLEKFCFEDEELEPQVAVSVDMMDTGVDAPRVVNLVFFKEVKSSSKFWQMIGRGTRLCPNLFGPGRNKEHFLIFDHCGNFDFFEEFPEGISPTATKSISQRIFELKLDIALELRDLDGLSDEDEAMGVRYIDELHHLIVNLDQQRFEVRKHLRMVNEYTARERWDHITVGDRGDIATHLSGLPPYNEDLDDQAKQFDMLLHRLQSAMIYKTTQQATIITTISSIGADLYKKRNVPAVSKHLATIQAVQQAEFWQDASLNDVDRVRTDLRELIKFIDKEKQETVYTGFEDEQDPHMVEECDILPAYTQLQSYRDRVESYLRKNKRHLTIDKVRRNIPITPADLVELERLLFVEEVGTRKEYEKVYGDMPLGRFIRSILGLDVATAQQLFADFIQRGSLRADQITFINTLINYLTSNGVIDKRMLFQPPFTHVNDQGITGVFNDDDTVKIICIIDRLNGNAELDAG